MSDQNHLKAELEVARAQIRRLAKEIAEHKKQTEHPVDTALLAAGVPREAIADARKAGFRPTGNLSTGIWTFGGKVTDDLEELAREWIEEHYWFRGAPAQTDNQPSADWPTDRNGNLLPISELTDEELYALAGMPPKGEPQQQESYTDAELATMSEQDRLAIQAGLEAKPDSEAKAKDRQSLEELNSEMDRRLESTREQAELQRESLRMVELKPVWGGK